MDKDYKDKLQKQIVVLASVDDTFHIGFREAGSRIVCDDAWYILFKKESTDGRDSPVYAGRTADSGVAQRFLDGYNGNPYVSARVDVYKDDLTYNRFPGDKIC